MSIDDLSIQKVAKDDPRYPETSACPKPFTDVYRLALGSADNEIEAVFYVTQPMTPDLASAMLRNFAGAIQRHHE